MRHLKYAACAAALGGTVLLSAPATAVPPDNWGQEVKACNQASCYPDGGSRGSYVRVQANDSDGPGYGWEIHTLAYPGNSQAYPPGH